MINKLSPSIYEVNSIIGPVDNKSSSLLSGSNDLFSGMGALNEVRNLENDINSLNSFSLVFSTVKKLNLEVGYYNDEKGFFGQTTQLFNDAPYTVIIDKSHIQSLNARFFVEILNNNSYRLSVTSENVALYNYVDNMAVSYNNTLEIDTICSFNETITNSKFKFSLTLNSEDFARKSKEEMRSYFEFYHLDQITGSYLRRIKVEPVNIKSSLLIVKFSGGNIDMTIEFLNKYLQNYLDENLIKKNKAALNTIKFIDSQISEISDSLVITGSKLRDFRSANQVTDLSYQGQQALEQMTKIENERSTLQIQQRYYNYVLDYFEKNQDMAGLAPPSAANVVDPIMNTLIIELLSLNSQRSTILSNNAEKNLYLGQLENKIKLQKQTILENVKNSLNTIELTINELNYRAEKISKEISKLPRTELNMVSMQREFNLTDAIYTFLLQKRSEAAITMASNYPDYEILEPARVISSYIISPKRMINLLLALVIAILIPTGFIILRQFFNEKIASTTEVEKMLNKTVLNVIYSNTNKTEAVVSELPGSSITESFRNLRSSLFLKFRSEPLKTIMITSSQPQDGKSFISFNLAASIASVGYKTIIVDCDLRRPKLHDKFKNDNSQGLSSFMMDHISIDQIIHKTDIDKLHFIPSGPILPNSTELFESGALDGLFDFLRKEYDYLIIDSTPAGLVSDTTPILKYASLILLVCRNNYTRKDIFNNVLNIFRSNGIENFEVVFNDLNFKKSRYGRYNAYYKKD
jgi:capsular exopolysaccharide synthesis family protein